jgi:C-terminal processing protease CtpA/Prc
VNLKRFIFIDSILFLMCGCSGTESIEQHLAIDEKYPAHLLKEDYEQLLRVLNKNHPALYDFTDKDEYHRLVKLQSEKITDSLTISEFYHVLLPLVSKIGCGHSGVHLPEWVWKDSTITLLPLKLFFHNKRGYVINNYTPYEQLRVGTEILAINGTSISSLLQRLETCIPTDGNNFSAKREVLNEFFNQLISSSDGFPHSYEISFQSSETDSIQEMIISSIKSQLYFDAQPKSDSLLQFEIDSARNTAFITIKSFGFYDRVEEFKTFVDNSFSQIRQAKIDHVILDLRNNSGGDPFCSSYLMTYLAKEPVPYFSKSYQTYTALAKPLPLSINHFSGKLYTLINGICFSSTAHLCALLKYHHIGEFIGTETGGTYICNDNSQIFRLINTGILVRTARSTFAVAVEGLPRFKGILPDYTIGRSLRDMLASDDPIKEFAIKRIEEYRNGD